jgi:hypothetical protein
MNTYTPLHVKPIPFTCFVATCVTTDWHMVLEKNDLLEDLLGHPRLLWVLDEISLEFLSREYPSKMANLKYDTVLRDPYPKSAAVVFKGKLGENLEFSKANEIREWNWFVTGRPKALEQEGVLLNAQDIDNYFITGMMTEKARNGSYLKMYIPRMMTVEEEKKSRQQNEEETAERLRKQKENENQT